MNIRPVGAELFHADGRTNMTKLTVVSRNFANATKNKTQQIDFRLLTNNRTGASTGKGREHATRWFHDLICDDRKFK
jgi:hypothetical protein